MTASHLTVGVLGGGQLGRMLALAGIPLGLRFRFLEPAPASPSEAVGEVIAARYDDPEGIARFAAGLDVVTWEFENIPLETVDRIRAEGIPVHPDPRALAVAQDRLREKETFLRLGVPTPPFRPVTNAAELRTALEEIGIPAVLKTRRMGYDGKGQAVIGSIGEVEAAIAAVGGEGDLIVERFVAFRRELSVIAVRGRTGEVRFWPIGENEHRKGILFRTVAPAPSLPAERQAEAEGYISLLLKEMEYVGVLALELFETSSGLLANEIAPRVHNSGHWTQDGAVTSQFENHIRAVVGLPLGETGALAPTVMLNLVGGTPPSADLLEHPGTHLHLYDKEPRPDRKLGHVNVVGAEREVREAVVAAVERSAR